jgi:HSP20 family molecular chaperone IbpA
MDILTSIPVQVSGPESIPCVVNNVKERIARRAYESFVERGSVHGHELDDWLNAERELIVKPVPVVRAHGADIFVEMLLPEIDLYNLTVHVAPSQLVISSDPDEDGLQLCQMIDLPCEISLDGVDAEQLHNMLHVTAAVAQSQPEPA